MLLFFRTLRLLPVFLLVSSIHLRAQDMPIRVEAVRLLERANGVSRPGNVLSNRKYEVTFRAYRLDGTTQDGVFNVIRSGDIERYETVFGEYHAISIHYPDRIVQNDYQPPPPETLEVDGLTPLMIGQFDKSDTIHSITPATLFGRRAKCIHFETVNGRTRQSNEICVDEELGMLVRWNVGEDLIENTDYSPFEGMLLPTRVWLPSIQPSARSQTIRANEKPDASAVSREWPQQGADDIRRPIVALDLDFASLHVALSPEAQFIRDDRAVAVVRRDVNTFPNRASGVLPHEPVGTFSGIVENLGHGPRGQKWNLFAVYSAPEKPPFVPLRVQHLCPTI